MEIIKNKIYIISKINLINIGRSFFVLGIFLLPSAFIISAIFLFLSLIISSFKSPNFFADKWNIAFLTSGIFMILTCIISPFSEFPLADYEFNNPLNWIGLLNWIPFFWIFWAAQIYLETEKARTVCAGFLIAGTLPVLFSGFGQYFFGWYGPLEFLNGLIIWYQRSPPNPFFAILTGPFNNPNYAGAWLATLLPFCFYFLSKKQNLIKKSIFFFLTNLFILAIILTHSRNALIGIFLSFLLLIGINFKTFLILVFAVIFLIFIFFTFDFPLNFLSRFRKGSYLYNFIPENNKLSNILSFTRIKIWQTSINQILLRPILGWGSASFSIIYMLNNKGPTFQHNHNLILEVAFNYGIISAVTLFGTLLYLLNKSQTKIFNNKFLSLDSKKSNTVDNFWWTSTLIIFLMHFSDITYYDGRISILFWILMAGLRSIIRQDIKGL